MNILKKVFIAMLPLALGAVGSCSDDKGDDGPIVQPDLTLSAPEVASVTYNSMTVSVEVKGASVGADDFAGVCYTSADASATPQDPTVGNDKVYAAPASGKITADLTNLRPETNYAVRGFVSTGGKVYYSSVRYQITEKDPNEPVNPTPAEVIAYRGPAYKDDYRLSAGWDQRSQWNLANVHDPTVMLADDGYYYMYQTDASFGNAHTAGGHFHGRRSKDLVNWEYLGGTMQGSPAWINEKVNEYRKTLGLPEVTIDPATQGFWAPCARNIGGGKYRMYYSVVNDGTLIEPGAWPERSFIGLMETSDPASNVWEDKGFVICAASDRGTNWKRNGNNDWNAYSRWNAIDPTFIITPEGEHWLIYGSWHSGFAAVQLDPATGKTLNALPNPWGTKTDIAPYGKLVATRDMNSRWQGSEGPEVVYRDGYYYMFMAYDGLDVPYNTRVVRSAKIDGPYVDMYGTDVTNKGGQAFPIVTHPYKFNGDHGWVGISHCAIFDDGKGNWFYSSQARFPNGYDDWAPNAIMLGHVRAIRWTKDGWPLVMPERYGAVPQIPIKEAEVAGTYENIALTYDYGKQHTSTTIVLADDHTCTSGAWKGQKWSFDEASQVLTLGSREFYLMRECDWEMTDRRATIVYAGLGDHRTFWGKKVK